MKKIKLLIMSAALLVSITGHCWVNDITFIKGKVQKFDKDSVTIVDAKKNSIRIPRKAIPKAYPLRTMNSVKPIPVYASDVKDISWSHHAGKVDLSMPKLNIDNVKRQLASEIEKAKKPKHH